jgi:cytochrome P450
MTTALFLQSETENPYAIYERMLEKCSVAWDGSSECWMIYSYEKCKSILSGHNVVIPGVNPGNKSGLNEYALLILDNLVRLANGQRHEMIRSTAMLLFEQMDHVVVGNILNRLPPIRDREQQIDWVNEVCRLIPVMYLSESFRFELNDQAFIADHIEQLTKLMSPARTLEQVAAINLVAEPVYRLIEDHLLRSGFFKSIVDRLSEQYNIESNEILLCCVSNLLGLLIQSYDAGRGLLSNSLIHVLRNNIDGQHELIDREYIRKSVVETLRFDPPVQNTRRVATNDLILDDKTIRKGELIVVMIAAANRDPMKFGNPQLYDINRANNSEHLTFGHGPHACVANHFSVMLATETLEFLFCKYKKIKCLTNVIEYEPLINVRLPKSIIISLD